MGEIKGRNAGYPLPSGMLHKQPLLLRQPRSALICSPVHLKAGVHAAVLRADIPPAAVLPKGQRSLPIPLADRSVDVIVTALHLRMLLGQQPVVPFGDD
ncbi:hypothetical protein D3C80_1380390 [compost metagenome]